MRADRGGPVRGTRPAGAPVARPLSWEQVDDWRLRPDQFTLPELDRWLTGDDPWAGMFRRARKLDRASERITAVTPA